MDRKHNLSVAALDVTPVGFDFGEGYGETWETVYPDVDSWDLAQCWAYLDDQGRDYPDPDPFGDDDPADLFNIAEELGVEGFETLDDQDDAGEFIRALPEGVPFEAAAIRAAIVAAIDDEEADGIEDWRDAVREAMDDADAFAPMMNYYYPLPYLPCSAEEAQEKVMDTACVVVMVHDEPALALAGGGMDLSPDICRAYVALGYYPPMHFASNLTRLGAGYREITPELVDICLEGARIAEGFARRNVEDLERFAARVEEERRQG